MNKIYQKIFPGGKNTGFTLVELLVVVLIIGILAAVAVPKYEVAVARTRYQKLVLMGTSIAEAEQLYFMANGKFTTDFSLLDFDFGEAEFKENESGTYNKVVFDDFFCTLRDYAEGSVQCHDNWNRTAEFGIDNQFTRRMCYASKNYNPNLYRRVCQSETGKNTPDRTSDSYDTYFY